MPRTNDINHQTPTTRLGRKISLGGGFLALVVLILASSMASVQASTRHRTTLAPVTTTTTAKAVTTTTTAAPVTTTTVPVTTTTTAPPAPVANVTLVRLRLTIVTTSDWTQVRLLPGKNVASKIVSQTAGVSGYTDLGNGWQIKSAGASNTLVMDTVYTENTGISTISMRIQKGWLGATTVTVDNTTVGSTRVFSMTDSLRTGTDLNYQVQTAAARSTFMGASQLVLQRADARHLTLATFYPWWGTDYSDPTLADRPTNPRSTILASDIQLMTQQAHDNGVDGFLVSYAGSATNGPPFRYALDAAAAVGNVAAPYIETTVAPTDATGSPDAATIELWIRQSLNQRANPGFLKSEGIPVVFIYQMQLLPVSFWTTLSNTLAAEGNPVRFEGEAPLPTYNDAVWGVHRYGVVDSIPNLQTWSVSTGLAARAMSAIDPTVKPKLFAATVSPGYDDHLLRGLGRPLISRGTNGDRYTGTWDAAVAGSPDWVIVTSWNEWWEGSSIEPGVLNGSLSLQQTAARSAAWKAQP